MICCDRCQKKQNATYRVGWSESPTAINLTGSIVLCDKCYKEFMVLFGNFKEAK